MFPDKKTLTQAEGSEKVEIDFAWVFLMARTKFGLTRREAELMRLGEWLDYFETYKSVYNFETARRMFEIKKEEERGSLLDL